MPPAVCRTPASRLPLDDPRMFVYMGAHDRGGGGRSEAALSPRFRRITVG